MATGAALFTGAIAFASGPATALGLTIDAGTDATVNEGAAFARSISISDTSDDGDPGWSYSIDYGDGVSTVGTTTVPTLVLDHAFADGPSAWTITVVVTDTPGEVAGDTVAVSVVNVPPTVTVTGSGSTTEGATYTMTVDATDPGDPRSELTFIVAWADGSFGSQVNRPLGPVSHVFLDDADGVENATTRSVVVTVFDDVSLTNVIVPVVVMNVAPTIALSGAPSTSVGSTYSLTLGTITDPARTDVVTERHIRWGDGTSDVVTSAGSFTHVFQSAGARTIEVDLVDEDGTHVAAGSLAVSVAATVPTAPTGLVATATSRSTIQLAWSNTSNQTAVYVERCRGAGCTAFSRVATLAGTATSFRDSGLRSNTTYRYRVRSRNAAGFSPYSAIAAATTRR